MWEAMDAIGGYITQLKASMLERLSGLHQKVGDSSVEFWRDDDDNGESRYSSTFLL